MYAPRFLTVMLFLFAILTANMATAEEDEFQWNIAAELGFVHSPSIIKGAEQSDFSDFIFLNIWLEAYYKGFFIQTNNYRNSGVVGRTELGYEILVEDDYEIDFIYKSYFAGFDQYNAGAVIDELIEELEGIDERKYSPHAGLRYMRYFDKSVAWIDVAYELFGGYHNGWVVDTFYNRVYEIRNWDISVGGGATYFSDKTTDYFFGIDANEVALNRPVYETGSGYRVELESSAQYPISQDWLFTIGATYSHFSNSIANSPIVARQNVIRFRLSVSYVF